MNKEVDKYLLMKYAIPNIGDYSSYYKPGSILCEILYRLNKNKKLDHIDKEWIKDKAFTDKQCTWIQDRPIFCLYKYYDDLEQGRDTKESLYHLHENNFFPYKNFISPVGGRYLEAKNYLFEKYSISKTEFKTDEYDKQHELFMILLRLHKNNMLDDIDKSWLLDNGRSKLYTFVEMWEKSGSPIFDFLYSTNFKLQENDFKYNDSFVHIRKPHMALHYKKAILIEHIKSNLEHITPSNIDEYNISALFLPKIWDTIHDSIKKDINELFRAYGFGLWTATSLLAYRIFENVLKVHIEDDLEEEPAIDITDAIKKLEKHKYDPNLIKILYELKEHRNSYMHGNTIDSIQDAKESIVTVMSLTMVIHNIKP